MRYQPISHTLYIMLHHACILNSAVLTTVIEMVEILEGGVCKHSVEQVRYVIKKFLHFGHCEVWSLFTRSLYLHLPLARENTDTTRKITRHISR